MTPTMMSHIQSDKIIKIIKYIFFSLFIYIKKFFLYYISDKHSFALVYFIPTHNGLLLMHLHNK